MANVTPVNGSMNPNQGNTQTVFNQGEPSKNNREPGTKATQSMQFSQHPGHGSAKRTIASEKNG